MDVLSGQESAIYELIRKGIQPTEIAKRPEYQKASSLYTIVERLTTLGFVEKQGKNRTNYYLPLITEYDIVENKGMRLLLRKKQTVKPMRITDGEPFGKIIVTFEQKTRIFELCISGKKTSMISKELGLPRYVINREIIHLGINRD